VPTVFADSSFLIGLGDDHDQFAREAAGIEVALRAKSIGFSSFLMSDYVLVEVFHRLQDVLAFPRALDFHRRLVNQARIRPVSREIMERAITTKLQPFLNARTARPPIGLVDATSLVLMDREKVRRILSFDGGFDNIPNVRRISSAEAVSEIFG